MPASLNIKVKYFAGTMENASALYDEVAEWLKATKHSGYQINSTPHFHEEDRMWHMIVTVMYKVQVGVNVLEPGLILQPVRVD